MVKSALLTLLNTLKPASLALLGLRTITHTGSFIYCFNMGMTALFSFPYTFNFFCLYLSVCPPFCLSICQSICLSVYRSVCLCVCMPMCICVCLSFSACVCLYVVMYYLFMYVFFIVINVYKLLHVRRPTSSPRAVWNPCKIKKH